MSLIFTVIGDSNVKKHMNATNRQGRPLLEASQVLLCTRREMFPQCLSKVRPETNVCVISCITNFLTDTEESSSSVSVRVDPLIESFFSKIVAECESNSARRYLISPPMYRRSPLWYRDGIAEVLSRFSSVSSSHKGVANLGMLPSFPAPAFESDGIHLTPFSGQEFVLHLFSSSQEVIASLSSPPDEKEAVSKECARLFGDRLVAVEQDHRRLNSAFELKTAIDAEMDDFRENERNEDCIVISGLPRIPGRLSGKEWQNRALQDVQKVLEPLMGRQVDLVVAHNATAPNSEVTYNVQLRSLEDARAVRAKFGSFFSRGRDARPPELANISIQNSVTKETRVRISILKLIAKRYVTSNPEGNAQVIGYRPRPILKITPPPTAKDRRVRSYNFIEAIQKFPVNFSDDEVGPMNRRLAPRFPGKLRSLFVVLSDDIPRASSKRASSPSGSGPERSRARIDDESEES